MYTLNLSRPCGYKKYAKSEENMHASEISRTFRDTLHREDDSGHFVSIGIPPGSLEESEALQAIDRQRFEEVNPPTHRALRRRARRHWSDREHALRGR